MREIFTTRTYFRKDSITPSVIKLKKLERLTANKYNLSEDSIMKKIILIFLSICFFSNSQAQVSKTIIVTTAGTLTTLLTLNEKTTITNLIVTGNIDARDFKCMRDELTVLTVLDMNAVTIMAYTGSDGTFINETTMYPENEIPQFSFYYSNPTNAPLKSILYQILLLQ